MSCTHTFAAHDFRVVSIHRVSLGKVGRVRACGKCYPDHRGPTARYGRNDVGRLRCTAAATTHGSESLHVLPHILADRLHSPVAAAAAAATWMHDHAAARCCTDNTEWLVWILLARATQPHHMGSHDVWTGVLLSGAIVACRLLACRRVCSCVDRTHHLSKCSHASIPSSTSRYAATR